MCTAEHIIQENIFLKDVAMAVPKIREMKALQCRSLGAMRMCDFRRKMADCTYGLSMEEVLDLCSGVVSEKTTQPFDLRCPLSM